MNMKKNKRLIKKARIFDYILGFQGVYYLVTGLWALISIDSFNFAVGHAHEGTAFEMHSIAAMASVLGILFILGSINKIDKKAMMYTAIGIALSVVAVELVYLPSMGWNLFWIDLVEESLVALILMYGLRTDYGAGYTHS